MSNTIQIDRRLIEEIHEDLIDLRGEWMHRKDEVRSGYAASFSALEARIAQLEALLGLPQCEIFGSEIAFRKTCNLCDVERVAKLIWDHPEAYSQYRAGTDAAYYNFLKYLWIRYPDGVERRLADVAGGI